jgi:hypothetical protein
MFSILPHTHAFRCRRPGPAPVYLASQPTVTGTVNTGRISYSYLGCALRTAPLNDDCRPHPTTVAAAPHYPHTRPPDVPARLVYQRILVNTYRTSDLCRPRGRARPPSASCDRRAFALTRSGAGVDLPGFGRGRTDMSDREDDAPAARGVLGSRTRRTADRDDDRHSCNSKTLSDGRWWPEAHRRVGWTCRALSAIRGAGSPFFGLKEV